MSSHFSYLKPPIRIGARGSLLSQVQARAIQSEIFKTLAHDSPELAISEIDKIVPIHFIKTTGDRIQNLSLQDLGGKALFTKEIEEALLRGEIDCAVHCLKDMANVMDEHLGLAAYPEREDPRDVLISKDNLALLDLPARAKIGTNSLRRQAQILALRPDLIVLPIRGNVDTRLKKLLSSECDAVVLAYAGLKRLGWEGKIAQWFDPKKAPPAPGQGALAIQTRQADADHPVFRALHHDFTEICVLSERCVLSALEGSCRTAMGAYAVLQGRHFQLVAEALTPDGTKRWRRERQVLLPPDHAGACEMSQALGFQLGLELRQDAGDALNLVHG